MPLDCINHSPHRMVVVLCTLGPGAWMPSMVLLFRFSNLLSTRSCEFNWDVVGTGPRRMASTHTSPDKRPVVSRVKLPQPGQGQAADLPMGCGQVAKVLKRYNFRSFGMTVGGILVCSDFLGIVDNQGPFAKQCGHESGGRVEKCMFWQHIIVELKKLWYVPHRVIPPIRASQIGFKIGDGH